MSAATAIALLLGLAGLGAVVAPPQAEAATGTSLLVDGFTGSTTTGKYVSGGNFKACLTASGNVSGTPIPGCGAGADPVGSGVLRLTNVYGGMGFALYDRALPTKAGLDITFRQYQWNASASGGDGLSFFLTDGAYTLTTAGGSGGSLGYHNLLSYGPGVGHGLLGVGFDAYGNYSVETNDPSCNPSYKGSSPTALRSSVAVRGPGDAFSGYCLLGPAVTTTSVGAPSLRTDTGTRPAPMTTRVVVDPPDRPSPKVTVYVGGVKIVQVDEPAAIRTTPTFKFGWAAGTGAAGDNHEISGLDVASVDQILPDLRLEASTSPVDTGAAATVTWTASADDASGPVPAGEPVTLTADAPAGTTFGAPSGTGWSCTGSTAARVSCTSTSGTPVAPGSSLPALTVGVLRPAGTSGTATVGATVTSASDDVTLKADNSAATVLRWHPTVAPVQAPAVAASTTPAATTVPPTATGTGPFHVTVASGSTAVGTVSATDAPALVLAPAAGASGRLRATYRVTDADAGPSTWAEVGMDVVPVARDGSVTTDEGTSVVVTPGLPLGTGPFTYAVLPTGPDVASATVTATGSGPELTVTPRAGFSGPLSVAYRTTDAAGLVSAPATVDLTVRPTVASSALSTWLDGTGRASGQLTLPTPAGTAPFTYTLDGSGDLGTGTAVSLTPSGTLDLTASDASGSYDVGYRVTDGHGVTSAGVSAHVDVHPYLAPVDEVVGTARDVLRAAAPPTAGTGPFTWELTGAQVSDGSAHVDPANGAVTFDARGRSGVVDLALTARDADGLTSVARTVTFRVAPVAHDVEGDGTASLQPTPVRLTPTAPIGTDLTTVVTGAPATGDATVAVEGHTLAITPAPGFSGPVVVTYGVEGADGVVSRSATARLRVHPSIDGTKASVEAGTSTTVDLPAPVGTGPVTWGVDAPSDPAAGTVTVVDGTATIAASATWSGAFTTTFRVLDAAGLASTDVSLDVTVVPAVPSGSADGSALTGGTAGGAVSGPAPAPSGAGPFTFGLVGGPDPAHGTASIDGRTGVVTFRPATGVSGRFSVTYSVTDRDGTPSLPATVDFVIAPLTEASPDDRVATADDPARTPVNTPRTLALPDPVGSGPFTYELVTNPTGSQGTATLDASTGALRLAPAAGYSGRVALAYRVLDASGVASAVQDVRLEVVPVVTSTRRSATSGTPTRLAVPAAVGQGPFTWTLLVSPGTPASASMDPTTGTVTFTSAHGFVGSVALEYVVTDADGVRSDPQTLAVEVLAAEGTPREGLAAGGTAGDALATTGASTVPVLALASGLLLAGAALVVGVRRRTHRAG